MNRLSHNEIRISNIMSEKIKKFVANGCFSFSATVTCVRNVLRTSNVGPKCPNYLEPGFEVSSYTDCSWSLDCAQFLIAREIDYELS